MSLPAGWVSRRLGCDSIACTHHCMETSGVSIASRTSASVTWVQAHMMDSVQVHVRGDRAASQPALHAGFITEFSTFIHGNQLLH